MSDDKETPPGGGPEREPITCRVDDPEGTLRALHVMAAHTCPEAEAEGPEIIDVIQDVVTQIFQEGREQSYVIAGDFLDEDGNPRDRYIMRLNEMVATAEHPVLSDLALKVIPKKHNVSVEMGVHREIQERSAEQDGLRVPHVLGTVDLAGSDYKGVLMERLPKNSANKSLQGMLSSAKIEGMRLVISDDVFGEVLNAYEGLHNAGFIHKDINEGNLYLLNAVVRDVSVRGRKVRFVGSGSVVLLDFEQTIEGAEEGSSARKHQEETEVAAVDALLSQYAVDVDGEATDAEIIAEL